jgi:hypothetical protein
VIVRISGEGQWRVPDEKRDELNRLDDEIAAALETCSQEQFDELLGRLRDEVVRAGERVRDDEILTSDVVVPPGDTTLEEARVLFSGGGLIADV